MHRDLNAAEALASARDARERLAERIGTPTWYAPLYGLGIGGMIAAQSLTGPAASIAVVTCLLMLVTLYATWSRRTGVVVNGYRRGTTLPITLALVVGLVMLMVIAVVARHRFGLAWAPLACGGVAAVTATCASRAWDARWRADMKTPL
jgi:hypothetical protein